MKTTSLKQKKIPKREWSEFSFVVHFACLVYFIFTLMLLPLHFNLGIMSTLLKLF